MTADFEKLGLFYLGRRWDPQSGSTVEEPLLYDAGDLTTHGVIVGMTGSGKTGLAVDLLEEAAIDGVPSLVIDPKGDLTNLLLTFPELRAEDFRPWIDPAEASRQGETLSSYAETVARRWRDGLAEWGQDGARIARLRDSVDAAIYTPGSRAGLGLALVRSFAAPPAPVRADDEALRERVIAAASGLLALLGIEADPVRSREHILIANLLDRAWRVGRDAELGTLIQEIQAPPFDRLGVMELDSFYPRREREKLALQLNSLLAAPGFEAWLQGEPLDVDRLLFTAEGRPRMSILSLAHLSESERMFVVTLVLSELLAWMRTQPGTGSLRALLYMDEIFGFFPPSKEPPSKAPMLTLLKQARAYGVGILLATQNPVDLDYKGLANCGSWFIGRLQTERDKDRVLAGLEGASNEAKRSFDRRDLAEIIGGLGKRVFLLNNVHEDVPVLFQTRWALSYLRGPLVREQIETLMAVRKALRAGKEATAEPQESAVVADEPETSSLPTVPAEIEQRFLLPAAGAESEEAPVYTPRLYGIAQLHFKKASAGVDEWSTVRLTAPIAEQGRTLDWQGAVELDPEARLVERPLAGARYRPLPPVATRPKVVESAGRKLSTWLYRNRTLTLWHHPASKEYSGPGESEGDFRRRIALRLREERDRQRAELQTRHERDLAKLDDRIDRAQQKLAREKAQASDRMTQAAIAFGRSLLSAVSGRKILSSRNLSTAGTAMREVSRSARERNDVELAEESLEELYEQKAALARDFEHELEQLRQELPGSGIELEAVEIRPLKSDVAVEQVGLLWRP